MSVRRAIVLAGGGARGAYEAGVLSHILTEIPHARFDVICGTSVGSIHAAFLAATAHEGPERGERLAELWGRLRLWDFAAWRPRDLLEPPRWLLDWLRGRLPLAPDPPTPARSLYGLVHSGPLERLVEEAIPWTAIGCNLEAGHLTAVSLSATRVRTGASVSFVQGDLPARESAGAPAGRIQRVRLRAEHALASAAIPVLFPVVRIGKDYYADGGLSRNTPIRPATWLGADRVLTLSVQPRPSGTPARNGLPLRAYRNPLVLFGELARSLLRNLDDVDREVEQLERMDELLRRGEARFGPGFLDAVNRSDEEGERAPSPFRRVGSLTLRPSQDLGPLAREALDRTGGLPGLSPLLTVPLRAIGPERTPFEGELLSYLLFDEHFTRSLLELGRRDARDHHAELARFFED